MYQPIVLKEMNALDGRGMPRHFQEQLPSILVSIIFLQNGCVMLKQISFLPGVFRLLFQMCLVRVQEAQRGMDQAEANQLQVRVELQADCFAGVWAHHAEEKWRLLEPGDIEAALQTASAIGDDRLQRRSQGYVVPDAFTHGSSEQRARWLTTGLKSGDVASCDTFQSARF